MDSRLEQERAAIVEYPRGHVSYHAETYKLIAQRMCLESGVKLLTNTTLADCLCLEGQLTHGIVTGKSGWEAIVAKCFIDTTGETDLCRLAGVPMMAEAELQPLSLCFVLEGVDTESELHPPYGCKRLSFGESDHS